MQKQWKHAIVVGASQGIGEALVYELASQGVSVALVSRNAEAMNRVAAEAKKRSDGKKAYYTFVHDVTDFAAIPALFQEITRQLGGLDVIIYNAGIMPEVKQDEFSFETDKKIIDVNVLGAMAWLDEAAKRFRSVEEGTIVGISSIAGERGRILNPPYHASKAALTTYLESLRNRLSRHGVTVTTVKPGIVDTAMTKGAANTLWIVPADEVARKAIAAARKGVVVKYIPWKWRIISMILHLLPSFIFRRLSF